MAGSLGLRLDAQPATSRSRRRASLTGTPPRPAASGAEPSAKLAAWRSKYPNLVGNSSALAGVFGVLDKVSGADAIVLIRGESGTGKELIAEAIHRNSPRRNKPLVKVNCAALVETLLLSELFGHERGAFTGASARQEGPLRAGRRRDDLPRRDRRHLAARRRWRCSRVLQEREFERVGGTQPIRVDVRIIAATHRDLEQMVRDGQLPRGPLLPPARRDSGDAPAARRGCEDLAVLGRAPPRAHRGGARRADASG